MSIMEKYLTGAMADIVEDEAFKKQVENSLYALPNAEIDQLTYGIGNDTVYIHLDYVFHPSAEDFSSFVGEDTATPLSVLKRFYEKYCEGLVDGRTLMFHFLAYSTIGVFEVMSIDNEGNIVSRNLRDFGDFKVAIEFEVDIDYSNIV